jgi:mRNA interferase MazF
MTKETATPITTAIKGMSSEVRVGPENGLDHDCAVALDNVVIVPVDLLGRTVGYLGAAQEVELARSVVLAHDLQVPLLD